MTGKDQLQPGVCQRVGGLFPVGQMGVADQSHHCRERQQRIMGHSNDPLPGSVCRLNLCHCPVQLLRPKALKVLAVAVTIQSQQPQTRRQLRHIGHALPVLGNGVVKSEFPVKVPQVAALHAGNRHRAVAYKFAGILRIVMAGSDQVNLFARFLQSVQPLAKAHMALVFASVHQIAGDQDHTRLPVRCNLGKPGVKDGRCLRHTLLVCAGAGLVSRSAAAEGLVKIMGVRH